MEFEEDDLAPLGYPQAWEQMRRRLARLLAAKGWRKDGIASVGFARAPADDDEPACDVAPDVERLLASERSLREQRRFFSRLGPTLDWRLNRLLYGREREARDREKRNEARRKRRAAKRKR